MRVSFEIFTNVSFTGNSIGNILMDSIPTTSMPYSFGKYSSDYYLTNYIDIYGTNNHIYNGTYFVIKSMMYVDNTQHPSYPPINLKIENISGGNILYLKGQITHVEREMLVTINLIGSIVRKFSSLIVPRTNLDFIVIGGFVYECNKVTYKMNGEVEIETINEKDLQAFYNSSSF